MARGSALNHFYRARRPIVASRPRTSGALSRPYCGSGVPVVRGETCRKNSAIGTGRLFASPVGARKAYGNVSQSHCTVMICPEWPLEIQNLERKNRRIRETFAARATALRDYLWGKSRKGYWQGRFRRPLAGLFQKAVQIVATHDPPIFVRQHPFARSLIGCHSCREILHATTRGTLHGLLPIDFYGSFCYGMINALIRALYSTIPAKETSDEDKTADRCDIHSCIVQCFPCFVVVYIRLR